jgi:putative holliday junction resolvase
MGRILAIDFGLKRIGLAQTDPSKIIATAIGTIENIKIWEWLDLHFKKEEIEVVVIGLPKNLNNENTHATLNVIGFIEDFKKRFPTKNIETYDERFTSKMAMSALISSGLKKKDRAKKEMLDSTSATIILQDYLEYLAFKNRI